MRENSFTLEQVTEMAGRVSHWKGWPNNEPYSTHYVGEIRPKWYSSEKLEITVGRIIVPNKDSTCEPQRNYSATVTYGDIIVSEYNGENVSAPFQTAYQKKQRKEMKMQMALQDIRTVLSNTPEQSSVVKPVTLEDVLGLIKKVEDCKDTELTFGHVDYRFEGRVNVEGKNEPQKVLVYRVRNFKEHNWIVRVLFNGEKVFETRNVGEDDRIVGATYSRIDEVKKENQERALKEKLEKMKGVLFKKPGDEKK